MERWQEELEELRETLDEITKIQKRLYKIDVIGKTISLKNELDKVGRKLKTKKRTVNDIKKHMQLMVVGKILFGIKDLNSPLNLLHREIQLLTKLYGGLLRSCKNMIDDLQADNGVPLDSLGAQS